MGFWLEIRCEGDIGTARYWDEEKGDMAMCDNERFEGHALGVLTASGQADMLTGKRHLERRARARGWKRSRAHGWLCRHCQKHVR